MANPNTNTVITATIWAEILIEKFMDKVRKLGITDQNQLINSFTHEVIANSNGDVSRVELAYLLYAKFVDMGVGKGVKLSQVGKKGSRVARAWFNPVFWPQFKRLVQLLAQKQAQKGVILLIDSIDKTK